jgi:uncharacterized protein with NRDE domain
MCLILFAIDSHPHYPLVIGANRDEQYARPTRTLAPWPEAPQILAGQDLQAGGTWMGLARNGRFAAVTNVREDPTLRGQQRSRGELPRAFLLGSEAAADYAARAYADGEHYAGFNLLVGDAGGLYYCSNRNRGGPRHLPAGIYGLSNDVLDNDWRKVQTGKAGLRALLETRPDPAALLALLADAEQAPDALLPDTGIGLERERLLSSRFIASMEYGTRSSTALLIDAAHAATVWEQNFGPGGRPGELLRYHWQLDHRAQ